MAPRKPSVIVRDPGSTIAQLVSALLIGLIVIALAFGVLSYAYVRLAHRLDEVKQESVSNSLVLDRIQELASLFAELSQPGADREAIAKRLAELSTEIRANTQRQAIATTTTTTPGTTTTTTRPPGATTTTTSPTTTTTAPPQPTCTTLPVTRRCL